MFNLERFRELCKERGVKQSALFAMVGKTRSYSSDLNKIKNVPFEYVQTWAEALRTTPEYLMGETDDPGIKKEPAGQTTSELSDKQKQIIQLLQSLSPEQQDMVLERCKTLHEVNQQHTK